MKKLLTTKANDMTVGQVLEYLVLVFAVIYGPIYLVCWLSEKWDEHKKKTLAKQEEESAEESGIWKY